MDNFRCIFKKFCDKLENECVLEETSLHFDTLKCDYERFKFTLTLWENSELLPELEISCNKNNQKSEKFRNEGNRLFLKKKDMDALELYSMSVAYAQNDSEELSLAFANRSAVSFSLKQYQDCITDIDRALSGKYPEHLRYKLYERKGKSFMNMRMYKSAKESYENALNSVSKSKLSEDKAKCFIQAVKEELKILKAEFNDYADTVFNNKNQFRWKIPQLSYSKNEEIVAACDAIKIDFNKEMGRHIVATKTINPGDVLVIEQPYASVLLPSSYNLYCFNCLKRCHTLLPCNKCTKVLFCSDECKDSCYKNSHWVECAVLKHLIDLGFSKLELLAVRTLLVASKPTLKSLKEYIKNIDNYDGTIDERVKGFDENGKYVSDDYRTAHHLASNTSLRTNADLFRRSCFACCIIYCIDKLTNFFIINSVDDSDCNTSAITSENYGEYFDNKCFAGGLLLRYLQIMPCNAHEVSEMYLTKKITNQCVDGSIKSDGNISNNDNSSFIYDSREIGGALYPVLSLINHSCDPNVVRHSHMGDTVVLTAIQRIHIGEQILDNYGYHHAVHDLRTRQDHLLSQYHFVCKCVACCEDWPRYNLLPDKNILYKSPELRPQVEKSSKEFRLILEQVLLGNFSDDNILEKLIKHLSLLEDAVKRPWKEYSECQEAIKQTLSMHANHYIVYL